MIEDIPFRIDHNDEVGLNRNEGHASPIQEISQVPECQLDEEVGTTLCNQFKGVVYKFGLVLFPINAEQKVNYLRNWDLWGLFIEGIFFLLIIGTDQRFMVILYALTGGAGLVNFNIRSLGGKISYFQSLSILGYSMFPLLFITVILKSLTIFQIKYMGVIIIAELAATLWSIMSARAFIVINIQPTRKFVAIIPIAIIYFYMASHFIFYCYYSSAWKEGGEGAKEEGSEGSGQG